MRSVYYSNIKIGQLTDSGKLPYILQFVSLTTITPAEMCKIQHEECLNNNHVKGLFVSAQFSWPSAMCVYLIIYLNNLSSSEGRSWMAIKLPSWPWITKYTVALLFMFGWYSGTLIRSVVASD